MIIKRQTHVITDKQSRRKLESLNPVQNSNSSKKFFIFHKLLFKSLNIKPLSKPLQGLIKIKLVVLSQTVLNIPQ